MAALALLRDCGGDLALAREGLEKLGMSPVPSVRTLRRWAFAADCSVSLRPDSATARAKKILSERNPPPVAEIARAVGCSETYIRRLRRSSPRGEQGGTTDGCEEEHHKEN